MKKYNSGKIEKKWQKVWHREKLYEARGDDPKRKFYHLVMFAYPSGDLHIGHWYNFAPADVIARKRRMEQWDVMSPFGFDAFGLPAENAAIKNKLHPKKWTYANITRMRKQLGAMGPSYDWSREVVTSDPEYYKWTQWLFLQLYKKGLAYRQKVPANWCPSCKTILANEQAVDGRCERCDTVVERRELDQWLFKITDYAERLLKGLDGIDWPEKTKAMQKNWIGKSEGAEIEFRIKNQESGIRVFTTRPDTIFGATYLVVAPESAASLLQTQNPKSEIRNWEEVEKYIREAAKKTEIQRTAIDREKTGVELKGITATNPATKKEIPVWVADYVLAHYGTGAIMAVPAHDERDYAFAKKFDLPITWVISGVEPTIGKTADGAWQGIVGDNAYTGEGWMVSSGEFTGASSEDARPKMVAWMERGGWGKKTVSWRMHDWIISRQRYWGAPIPIIYCKKCGIVPTHEKDLPVKLPNISDYTPRDDGRSPLAKSVKFLKTKCPRCNGPAERETDTLDTFVDSAWYFFRYADQKNENAFAAKEKLAHWLPVDIYIGGAEHATKHLLYARFITKVLKDLGFIAFEEPFSTLRHQGIILGEDGEKMSKSRGNVVDPDKLVAEFGADTVRLYLCFMSDYGEGGPWNPGGINGVHRFLSRAWRLFQSGSPTSGAREEVGLPYIEVTRLLHQTIRKVSSDINNLRFNTAVSALMVLLRKFEEIGGSDEDHRTFLKLLAPFAPHITEEVWRVVLQNSASIHREPWPRYDGKLAEEETFELVVQINGKVRATLTAPKGTSEAEVEKLALGEMMVKKHLEGKSVKKRIFITNRLINFVIE